MFVMDCVDYFRCDFCSMRHYNRRSSGRGLSLLGCAGHAGNPTQPTPARSSGGRQTVARPWLSRRNGGGRRTFALGLGWLVLADVAAKVARAQFLVLTSDAHALAAVQARFRTVNSTWLVEPGGAVWLWSHHACAWRRERRPPSPDPRAHVRRARAGRRAGALPHRQLDVAGGAGRGRVDVEPPRVRLAPGATPAAAGPLPVNARCASTLRVVSNDYPQYAAAVPAPAPKACTSPCWRATRTGL